MKKFILLLFLFTVSFYGSSQVNIGFGTGTEFARIEAGITLTKNLHAGARFVPGFNLIGIPSYYAVYGRKTFDESELFGGGFINAVVRGYVGASFGLIRLKGQSTYDYYSGNYTTGENRIGLGFSGDAGGEILYGKTGKFGSFFELNIGQVPNYFNTISSSLMYELNEQETQTKLASLWGISGGFRFYF